MHFVSSRKKRFQQLFVLRNWWKRRKFQYLAHADTAEELSLKECREETRDETGLSSATEVPLMPQLAVYLQRDCSNSNLKSFRSEPSRDPFQDSVESMDSIIDSREPVGFTEKFLMEHLDFLRQSTQAQEVELVYDTN
mmetsp:Transcript_18579/g.51865  ORF Transcript_18579/g.51865 Transcript_18579/m.51865 type:complete len:138 (-) Transcript_18579:887-1300(-)